MKIRDETDDDIETFLDAHPHYMNKSELVCDTFQQLIEEPSLADRTGGTSRRAASSATGAKRSL